MHLEAQPESPQTILRKPLTDDFRSVLLGDLIEKKKVLDPAEEAKTVKMRIRCLLEVISKGGRSASPKKQFKVDDF